MRVWLPLTVVSRTTSKERWREIWRWKRIKTKELAQNEAQKIQLLRDDTVPTHIRNDIIDEIVNPPLLLGPLK